MRRFWTMLGLSLASYAVLAAAPSAVQAQVIRVQYGVPSYYAPPVYVAPPTVVYSAPVIAPSYPTTISYYPQSVPVYSYSAPVYTYSAPVTTYVAPAPGLYTTRTYYGYGIFRPRGYTTQTTYSPYYR